MIEEFTARVMATEVLSHLERRRHEILGGGERREPPPIDEEHVRREIHEALTPLRRSYEEDDLPKSYFVAVEKELVETIPARWLSLAIPFTRAEKTGFGTWRHGDPIARMTYVGIGLVIGALIVAAPFIPIWEKWFPFALAIASWWIPDFQARWYRRKYAQELGTLVGELAAAQPALDRHITVKDLLPPGEKL